MATSSDVPELAAVAGTPTDEEVVTRVLAGDPALYEILVRRNNQRLYRAVRAILSDEAEVEDVLQEAYLSAYDHLGDFAGRARFSTWLVRIAVNKALDRYRRQGRMVAQEWTDSGPPDTLPGLAPLATRPRSPERESESRELSGLLARAIDRLPVRYRTVYILREVEGLDTSEVAACLEIESGTVKTRLHRARAQLRASLCRDLGQAAPNLFSFGGHRCDALVASVLAALKGVGR